MATIIAAMLTFLVLGPNDVRLFILKCIGYFFSVFFVLYLFVELPGLFAVLVVICILYGINDMKKQL